MSSIFGRRSEIDDIPRVEVRHLHVPELNDAPTPSARDGLLLELQEAHQGIRHAGDSMVRVLYYFATLQLVVAAFAVNLAASGGLGRLLRMRPPFGVLFSLFAAGFMSWILARSAVVTRGIMLGNANGTRVLGRRLQRVRDLLFGLYKIEWLAVFELPGDWFGSRKADAILGSLIDGFVSAAWIIWSLVGVGVAAGAVLAGHPLAALALAVFPTNSVFAFLRIYREVRRRHSLRDKEVRLEDAEIRAIDESHRRRIEEQDAG